MFWITSVDHWVIVEQTKMVTKVGNWLCWGTTYTAQSYAWESIYKGFYGICNFWDCAQSSPAATTSSLQSSKASVEQLYHTCSVVKKNPVLN